MILGKFIGDMFLKLFGYDMFICEVFKMGLGFWIIVFMGVL